MSQLNLQITKAFLEDLKKLMRLMGISTKSEAIRVAVHEMVERLESGAKQTDYRAWLGRGLKGGGPRSPRRFPNEDSLWDKD